MVNWHQFFSPSPNTVWTYSQAGSGDPSPDNVRAISPGVTAEQLTDITGADGSKAKLIAPETIYAGSMDSEWNWIRTMEYATVNNSIYGPSSRFINTVAGFEIQGSQFPGIITAVNGAIGCDRLKTYAARSDLEAEGIMKPSTSTPIVFGILKSRMPGWDDGWSNAEKIAAGNTWLASNPLGIVYQLLTPVSIAPTFP